MKVIQKILDRILNFMDNMQRGRCEMRTEYRIVMISDLEGSGRDMYCKVRSFPRIHDTSYDELYACRRIWELEFVTTPHFSIQGAIDDNAFTRLDETFNDEFRKRYDVTVVMECIDVHPEYY